MNILEGVTSIGNDAFRGCGSLKSVTIPEGVTRIEDSAFSGCSSLTSVMIPDGVTSIGNLAFHGCSIDTIELPDSLLEIRRDAFPNKTLLRLFVSDSDVFSSSSKNVSEIMEQVRSPSLAGNMPSILGNGIHPSIVQLCSAVGLQKYALSRVHKYERDHAGLVIQHTF